MFSFNEKELKIIKVLASNGRSLVSTISKHTLLTRTSLYHTLQLLSDKGIVTKSVFEKSTYFELNPIEQIETIFKKEEVSRHKEKESVLREIKKSLANKPESLLTNIRHYTGEQGIEQCYYDSVYQNKSKCIYTLTDYDSAYNKLNTFLEKDYFPARIKNNIRVKSIAPIKSPTALRDKARNTTLLRDVKFANLFNDSKIELSVYDDKVSIIYFDPKNPTGVILKNEIVARAFTEIFDFIWKKV